MASAEQLACSDLIKSVHQRLRCRSKTEDPSTVWQEHVRDEALLKRYAEAMHKLATCYWDKTMEDSNKRCNDRNKWVLSYCESYFLGTNPLIDVARESEHKIMKIIDMEWCHGLASQPYSVATDGIKLLDVGSCYNPMAAYRSFDVTAVDIAPAHSSVKYCDFLNVKVSSEAATAELDKESLDVLPGNTFDVVLFSLLLEYLPSSEQRLQCCRKAYDVLKPEGILIIITPDSCHQGVNAKLMKCWRYALGKLGFTRVKLEKLEHVTCLVFRKALRKEISERWCRIHNQGDGMNGALNIPQDFRKTEETLESEQVMADSAYRTEVENDDIRVAFCDLPYEVE